jgi:predicted dehydrogenase
MRAALLGFGPEAPALFPPAFKAAGLDLACACGGPGAGAGFPPGVKTYPDAGALFSKEEKLELALVAGPAAARFKTALHAIENRLHVICEPPFCSSATEFEKLLAEAAARDLAFGVLQPWERTSAWTALEKTFTGGLLGDLFLAEARILREGPPPAGGVTAADGWQAFAILLAAVRRAPAGLTARLSPEPQKGAPPADSRASFLVHFPEADGSASLAGGAHSPHIRVCAAGPKGRLELDGDVLRLDVKGLPPETLKMRDGLAGASLRPELVAAELSDFVKEIKKELPAGSSLRNARYCVRLMKNAYYSASLRSSAVPL